MNMVGRFVRGKGWCTVAAVHHATWLPRREIRRQAHELGLASSQLGIAWPDEITPKERVTYYRAVTRTAIAYFSRRKRFRRLCREVGQTFLPIPEASMVLSDERGMA
jgi:hypothetical protein